MKSSDYLLSTAAAVAIAAGFACADPDPKEDLRTIAELDTAYQKAVERNDVQAMDAILHEEMILVLGEGTVQTRQDLLDAARDKEIAYERQVEDQGTQQVRLFGRDTAIVTARLWIKGVRNNGAALDLRLWFSDTYVRTPKGWRYAFGQASMPLRERGVDVVP